MVMEDWRPVAALALFTAYQRHRGLSIYAVAAEARIRIYPTSGGILTGRIFTPDPAGMSEHEISALPRKVLEVPPAGPSECIQFVFWHEFGHDVLNLSGLSHQNLGIPERGDDEPYRPEEWSVEWICDKFGYLMVMHEAGIPLGVDDNTYQAFFAIDVEVLAEMQQGSSRQPLNRIISADIEKHVALHEDKLPHRTASRLLALAGAIVSHED